MSTYKLSGAIFAGFCCLATSANAALINRGNGLIYDPDRDITWLQEFQLGGMSGTWNEADSWAQSLVFGGFDDWRLPWAPQPLNDPNCVSVNTDDFLTYQNCTGGEMEHLYYEELGNPYAPKFTDAVKNDYGDFIFDVRDQRTGFWTSTEFDSALDWPTDTGINNPGSMIPPADQSYHWLFYMNKGLTYVFEDGNTRLFTAVRDGDVLGAVPVPAAIWLMGSGLGSLMLLSRRKKANA